MGQIIIRAYNYGGQFQSFSGVDLELNNWAILIIGLIIIATNVYSQMITELAHLIDCTITGLISKIISYLDQKPIGSINMLECKGSCVILQGGPYNTRTNKVTFILIIF